MALTTCSYLSGRVRSTLSGASRRANPLSGCAPERARKQELWTPSLRQDLVDGTDHLFVLGDRVIKVG